MAVLSMAVCPQVIYEWKVCIVRYLQSQYFTCVSPQYTCGGPTETRGVSSPGQGQAEIKTVLWEFKILWNIRIENIMRGFKLEISYVWDPNTFSSHII